MTQLESTNSINKLKAYASLKGGYNKHAETIVKSCRLHLKMFKQNLYPTQFLRAVSFEDFKEARVEYVNYLRKFYGNVEHDTGDMALLQYALLQKGENIPEWADSLIIKCASK